MEKRNYIVKAEGKGAYSIYRRETKVKGIRRLTKEMNKILWEELSNSRNPVFELENKEKKYQVVLDENGEKSLFNIVNQSGEVVASKEYYRDLYVEISEITRRDDEAGFKAVFDFGRALI